VSLAISSSSSSGDINTVAGDASQGYTADGVKATTTDLYAPYGVAVDSSGNFYFSDEKNYRIRKVTASTGLISTIAGNGTFGGTGVNMGNAGNGGPATSVALGVPQGVALDSSGNVYYMDELYGVVRKITASTGMITTVAGPSYCSPSGAPCIVPYLASGIAVDASGNIYIADSGNYCVRKMNVSTGVLSTIAGTQDVQGYNGAGGPATSALFGFPTGVALDAAGNLYIGDSFDFVVWKVSATTGVISIVAGNNTSGTSGDGGLATNAELYSPGGVAVDADGNLYIADADRIRKVSVQAGTISTVAGDGTVGFSGDGGPAIKAELGITTGVAVSTAGVLYIADNTNNRIRAVGPTSTQPIITWLNPTPITYGTPLSATQYNASANVAGTLTYSVPVGTVLTAGSHTLSVVFTPTDTVDYSAVTASVPLTVNQAVPVIAWRAPANITSGTVLSATQLDASSSVSGAFSYSPAAGVTLAVGPHTLSTTFTPVDTRDYAVAVDTVPITVTSATGIWDSGTVELLVNNSPLAIATYGEGSTNVTVAAALAASAAVATNPPVTVIAVDDALYLKATTAGVAGNAISYSLQNTAYSTSQFSAPSFPSAASSGTLAGGDASGANSGPVYSYAAVFDGANNLTSDNDKVMGDWLFTPDTLNRLGAATDNETGNPNTNYCWGYDAFGNRIIQAGSSAAFQVGSPTCTPAAEASFSSTWAHYTTANNNRLTSTSQAPGGVSYDASGDVVNDGVNQYLYDGEGRVCAVASAPVSGGTILTGYIYNAGGERVSKGTIATWSCDPALSGFTATNDYVLGPGGEQVTEMAMNATNTMTWQHTNVYAAGNLFATYDDNGLHFYFNDVVGTRRIQTDYAGVMEQSCSGLPFGDGLNCSNSIQFPTEHHFTGKERDTESGLDYFGARYYASSVGRFMSPDWSATPAAIPFADPSDPQSLNQYSYVKNNPLNRTDPNGHNWFDVNGQWSWHQGDTWKDGKNTYTSKYTGLLVAAATGTDKKTGATTYSLTLYDQNKAVATGTGFSGGEGHPAVKDGNYMIRLDIRDPNGPNTINQNSPLGNPPPSYGIQAMHDIDDGQYRYGVVGAYGPMRARLNPIGGARDDGDYFHGQTNGHGWTHGCLCYGADTRFIDYMWNNMPHSPMPVSIDTPVQKP
jgi:RHS repeat-associated protein